MFVYLYIHNVHTYISNYTYKGTYTHISCVHIYIYIHMHVYVHDYIQKACGYVGVCVYKIIYVLMYVHASVCRCVNDYVFYVSCIRL